MIILYAFVKTLHQQEYQILKKGLDVGLSKKQIANIFRNQSEFDKDKTPPLVAICPCKYLITRCQNTQLHGL